MTSSYEFKSRLSIATLARWSLCIVLPTFSLLAVVGYALLLWPGVLIASLLSLFPFVLVIVGASRVQVRVICDRKGLQLNYDTTSKQVAWSDIRAVYRTRSILWRNLIRIEGTEDTIILNMNIQPMWPELVVVLSQHVPESKLQNFRWAEFTF